MRARRERSEKTGLPWPHEKAAAEKAAAEKAGATFWPLSEEEQAIIKAMG